MSIGNIVIGTIGADAHMIGGWVLQKALSEVGFSVTFLGAVVPQEEFIAAAIETSADAILVSSMYGMGIIDCEGLRERCIESGLNNILLYAGGNVAASLELDSDWLEVERRFREMGFDRVYRNTVTTGEVIAALKRDLQIQD